MGSLGRLAKVYGPQFKKWTRQIGRCWSKKVKSSGMKLNGHGPWVMKSKSRWTHRRNWAIRRDGLFGGHFELKNDGHKKLKWTDLKITTFRHLTLFRILLLPLLYVITSSSYSYYCLILQKLLNQSELLGPGDQDLVRIIWSWIPVTGSPFLVQKSNWRNYDREPVHNPVV